MSTRESLKALLVLGSTEDQQSLERFFKNRNHSITLCRQPEDASVALRNRHYEHAVIDLQVDEVGGLELCRELDRKPPENRPNILVLTSSFSPSRLRGALEAGADDFLTRPLELSVLQVRLALAELRTARGRKQQPERNWHSVLEAMHDGLLQTDSRGRIEVANRQISHMTGFSPSELSGRPIDQLIQLDSPGSADGSDWLDQYKSQPGPTISEPLMLETKGGRHRSVILKVSPTPKNENEAAGFVVIVQDVTEQRTVEEALRHREAYFRVLWESASDLISILDMEGRILDHSRSWSSTFNWESEEMVGRQFEDLIHPADRNRFTEVFNSTLGLQGSPAQVEVRIRKRNGEWRVVESLCNNLIDNPVVGGVVLTSRDMTEHRNVEIALTRQRAFFQQLFRNSPAGIVILDRNDKILEVNRAFVDLFQFEPSELLGKLLTDFIVPETLREEATELTHAVVSKKIIDRETVRLRKDGTEVDVSILAYPIELEDRRIGAYGLYTDITVRKQAERKLFHDAFHDHLTNLPNRTLLGERLERSLERGKRANDFHTAVLFLDLDKFKSVNDSLGHGAGDTLLVETARRLETCVRPGDTVARLAGDEFIILLEDIEAADTAIQVAQRIIEALEISFDIESTEVSISCSIGIALAPAGPYQADQLVRDADLAMYRAKTQGRARFELFSASASTSGQTSVTATELQTLLTDNQVDIRYWPVMATRRSRCVGFQAELTWTRPDHQIVDLEELHRIAERDGLTNEFGQWTARQLLQQLAQWYRDHDENDALRITLAITPAQLLSSDLVEYFDRTITELRLKATSIGFEVPAECLRAEFENALWALHNSGFRLDVTRFGSGSTNIAALHRLPVERVKLAAELVEGIQPGSEALEIARAVAAVAENLGLTVIAEGVESKEQLKILRGLPIDYACGPVYGNILSASKASRLIATSTQS